MNTSISMLIQNAIEEIERFITEHKQPFLKSIDPALATSVLHIDKEISALQIDKQRILLNSQQQAERLEQLAGPMQTIFTLLNNNKKVPSLTKQLFAYAFLQYYKALNEAERSFAAVSQTPIEENSSTPKIIKAF